VEGTQETVYVLHRFAQLAVDRISLHVTAGFRVEEDRLHDELQVTANVRATLRIETATVVIEDFRNAFDVRRARIARDQMLNQLFAEEWPNIWMVGQMIHHCSHV